MADDNSAALEVMRGQALTLGMKVDPNWTPEEFAQKIIDAQIAVKAKLDEDFNKAKKTKVRMLRDGFPLEDVKVPAGNTVDVPIEMARRWIELGVAADARPLPEL